MHPNHETLLCRYRYDPLDRLVDCEPSERAKIWHFYLKDRLATEIQGAVQRSIMQHDDQLLAQQQRQSGTVETRLLATDQQRSVLKVIDATRTHFLAYTPYGHRPPENGLLSLLGFNGEWPDPVTGCYLLGNGYRAFNPVLMRFNSPDSWSPFGEGGLNAYAYCVGDPINRRDRNGHTPVFLKSFLRGAGIMKSSPKVKNIAGVIDPAQKTISTALSQYPAFSLSDKKSNFLGFHGTSMEKATNMLSTGVHDSSNSFFITNTFEGAQSYANLHKKGAVVAVYTDDFDMTYSNSARGTAKAGTIQIEQVKISKAAHTSLKFEITNSGYVSSNLNRFMSEQESISHGIMQFRKQL
ncbi:RHS repeat-associated core domain-containing protein [Pseudomonas sp. TH41]|uniref:RHS repeat-associated core domain-containing protein n=1 Tax=Pseudomonas sp. TH41 TaxID=2796405 RepID=UPI001F5BCF69|nr:RHS repeat-associated core domain-containing protein [Pseudomonas sp. TH41]